MDANPNIASTIGTIEYLTTAKRYLSNGAILKNDGFGWKVYAHIKIGLDPASVFNGAVARRDAQLVQQPAFSAYRQKLHDLAEFEMRWKLHAAVELLADDPDGVWSEVCDGATGNVQADVEDVVQLCQLYHLAARESRPEKAAA